MKKKKKKSENIRLSTMRANSVPGGTIREAALFFQTVAAGGGGHYSRGGTIRASTVHEIGVEKNIDTMHHLYVFVSQRGEGLGRND